MDKRSITILPALAILLLLSGCGSDKKTDTQTTENVAPTVNAGADVSINQGDSFAPTPMYSDSDGETVSEVWTYNGATITFPKNDFAIGEHILTFSVMDDDGAITTDTVKVTVVGASIGVSSFKSLLKTGQTESYHNNDDGASRKGVARSYSRDDDVGIVTDNVTGLLWQDNEDVKASKRTWQEAIEYCQELKLGDFDWRLPSIEELATIVNKGKYRPAISRYGEGTGFEKIKSQKYWSSTTYSNGSDELAWTVDFKNGDSNGGRNVKIKPDNESYVRCVKK